MDWESALGLAQEHNIADANSFPKIAHGELYTSSRLVLVELWRTALVAQMLTPAPNVEAITWKRSQLRDRQWHHIGIKDDPILKAITNDEAWLAAHPSRKSPAASRQGKNSDD
jgi:hypothetical protein